MKELFESNEHIQHVQHAILAETRKYRRNETPSGVLLSMLGGHLTKELGQLFANLHPSAAADHLQGEERLLAETPLCVSRHPQ